MCTCAIPVRKHTKTHAQPETHKQHTTAASVRFCRSWHKQPKFAAECRGPYTSAISAGIRLNTAPYAANAGPCAPCCCIALELLLQQHGGRPAPSHDRPQQEYTHTLRSGQDSATSTQTQICLGSCIAGHVFVVAQSSAEQRRQNMRPKPPHRHECHYHSRPVGR
jgi:hypothetical protein